MINTGILGILLFLMGIGSYVAGVIMAGANVFFHSSELKTFSTSVIWYSGIPVLGGLFFSAFHIFILRPRRHLSATIENAHPVKKKVVAVLTAYNDELSIAAAVRDFKKSRHIGEVIVVDNNSRDKTVEVARKAGARVLTETKPGYGQCVFRALTEGLNCRAYTHILLCEGDMTFRAFDVEKFLAYAPHVDIVNGTRILEQLRANRTQLSTFMYYGNFFVGKLLEIKHIGLGTFTDVGTTYKLCSRNALTRLLPYLNPEINLEFNAHFLDMALQRGLRLMECPITFHARIGISKGGNVNNARALMVGLRMIRGLAFGWAKKKN